MSGGKYDKINNYNLSYENLLEAVSEFEGYVVGLSNNDLFLFDNKDELGAVGTQIRAQLDEEAEKNTGLNNFIKYVASRILDRTTGTYFFNDMFNGRVQDKYFKYLGEFQTATEQSNVVGAKAGQISKEVLDELTAAGDGLKKYLHIIPPTSMPFDVEKSHNKFVGCVPFVNDDHPVGNMRDAIKYYDSLDVQRSVLFNANNEPVYEDVNGQKVHKEYFSGLDLSKSVHKDPDINEDKIGDRFKKPTLAGIVIRHPKASLMSRNKSHLPIFFNAISTLEMSRCTPYIEIRILTQDFTSKGNANFGDMSQVKFMRFQKKTGKDTFELDDAIGLGHTTPVNNAETPGEDSIEKQNFNYSYMDVFNTPQTFSNADINAGRTFFPRNNDDPILEPISPFLTLTSLNVNITGAGFGLMASKRADLSLVLHDRSRLRDLAPLVSSTQFATTKIIVEYGWNHPEGGVGSDNIIGKYLDALKDRSIFQVVGSNFSFGDGNTVKIDVDLAAYGFRQNERVHCGAGPEVPLNMIEEYIEKATNDLIKEKKQAFGKNPPKDAPQVFQRIKLNSRSARSTDAMMSWTAYSDIASSLKRGTADQDLLIRIKSILDKKIDKDTQPTQDPGLTGIIYKELENKNAVARIFGKLEDIKSENGIDPFMTSTVTDATPKNVVKNTNKQSEEKQVSLGKILSHFVGHPLSATCLYDEVQLVFYPLNHHAAGGRVHTTASLPIPVNKLYDNVVDRLKTNSHLSVKGFVALIEKIIRDKNLPVYQLADFYTVETSLKSKNYKDKQQIILSRLESGNLEGLGIDETDPADKDIIKLLKESKFSGEGAITNEDFFNALSKKEEVDPLNERLVQLGRIENATKGSVVENPDTTKKYDLPEFDKDGVETIKEVSHEEAAAAHRQSIADANKIKAEKEKLQAGSKRFRALQQALINEAVETRKSNVTDLCKKLYAIEGGDGLSKDAPAEAKFVRPNIALDYEVIDVIQGPQEYNDKVNAAASKEGPHKDHESANGLKTNKQILRVHVYDEEAVMDPAKYALLSTLIEGSTKVFGGDNYEKMNSYVEGMNFNDIKQFVKRAYPTIIYGAANSTVKNVSVQSNTSGDLAQVLMVEAYGNQKNGQVEGFNYENEYESITMFPNTVTISLMGQPMIGRGNNIFIDFGTNTSVDNIYTVKSVSHSLSEGEFNTTLQVVPANMGSISTFKERLTDTIERLDPET